jgi:hypothetical protein
VCWSASINETPSGAGETEENKKESVTTAASATEILPATSEIQDRNAIAQLTS